MLINLACLRDWEQLANFLCFEKNMPRNKGLQLLLETLGEIHTEYLS